MHVTLVYPPAAEVRQPYPALPALGGYLRDVAGCRVTLVDANIDAFHHFTSARRLLLSTERLQRELSALEELAELGPVDQRRYLKLINIVFDGPSVAAGTAGARETMTRWDPFMDPDAYHDAVFTLNRSLQLISAEFAPASYDSFGFRLDGRETTVEGLFAAAEDSRVNPFVEFFEEQTVPAILAGEPQLVGLSVGYVDQLLPALTLARLLRRAAGPELCLVAGGALLLSLEDEIRGNPAFFRDLDGYVLHDGEVPLARLVEEWPGGDLARVPNLLYLHGETGEVRATSQDCAAPVSDYPTPAYDLMPLDRYLTPEVVYHLQSSRGCYWNRCAFCTRPVLTPDRNFRKRKTPRVLADVDRLRELVGARLFAFYDDSVPPATLGEIADHLRRTAPDARWYAEVKFEPIYTLEFLRRLREGGCRMLFFGLESASQRVLDLMDKGMKIEAAGQILDHCEELDLPVVLGWFVGFPGERLEDHQATVSFIEHHHRTVVKADPLRFTLYRHSLVYRDAGNYGITRIIDEGQGPLALHAAGYEVEEGLITAGQAAALANQAGMRLSRLGLMESRSESHLFLAVCRAGGARFPQRSQERFLGLRPRFSGQLSERSLAFPLDRLMAEARMRETRVAGLVRLRGEAFRRQIEEQVQELGGAVPRGPWPCLQHTESRSKLTGQEMRVLDLCDGQRSVGEIIAQLAAAEPPLGEDLIYPCITEALRKGILSLD
jgi:anaerobic magnesium-protoporphyrin IX monomethyl ester cyclase